MKKLIMAILSIAIFTVACKKAQTIVEPNNTSNGPTKTRTTEDNITFNGQTYRIQNGMLNFSTFSEYENLYEVEDANTLQDFAERVKNSTAMTSYVESITNEEEKDKLSYIGSIVNAQGLLKVDVYTLLLDFNAERVFATRYGTIQDLLNAKAGNVASNVIPFTMNEHDVIEELIEYKKRGIICNAPWAPAKNAHNTNNPLKTKVLLGSEDQNAQGDKKCELFIRVEYGKYGIYFELRSKYWPTAQVAANNVWPPYSFTTTYSWTRRCGNSGSGGQTYGFNGATMYGVTPAQTKYLAYGNVRALRNYSLTATVYSAQSLIANDSRQVSISY
jgi:hypothetical protein